MGDKEIKNNPCDSSLSLITKLSASLFNPLSLFLVSILLYVLKISLCCYQPVYPTELQSEPFIIAVA